jgi:ankyrin repeat protein
MAAQNGHLEIVKVLVGHGAEIDKVTTYNSTPLLVAAQNEHLEIVKVLLDHGAEVLFLNIVSYFILYYFIFCVAMFVFAVFIHSNIQVTGNSNNLIALVCKSSKRDAFQVATELITIGWI